MEIKEGHEPWNKMLGVVGSKNKRNGIRVHFKGNKLKCKTWEIKRGFENKTYFSEKYWFDYLPRQVVGVLVPVVGKQKGR